MSKAAATVTGVFTNTAGQSAVNVNRGGGPDGIPGVINALPGYFPQAGDKVVIEEITAGVWVVTGCLTPNRGPVIPRVPKFTIANDGPPGWTQIAGTFADPATTENPDMVFTPTTVIIPDPPSVPTTVSFLAYAADSYRTDLSRWDGVGKLYQGTYGGYGAWSGIWLYPAMTAALSGHTITGCRIRLHRAAPAGSAGPVQTHLYLHNHATLPVGAPTFISLPHNPQDAALTWEASADVVLPLSWAEAIQAGTAAGVGISGADQDTYSTLYGPTQDAASGQLFVDYT